MKRLQQVVVIIPFEDGGASITFQMVSDGYPYQSISRHEFVESQTEVSQLKKKLLTSGFIFSEKKRAAGILWYERFISQEG